MRAILQRVSRAQVTVDGKIHGKIAQGYLILLGVAHEDTKTEAKFLVNKIVGLRIFNDDEGKMNLSIDQVDGQILVVSQFTLFGDCRKGRRPGFTDAAPPEKANSLYEYFCEEISRKGIEVQQGCFQTEMKVELVNDGPVTLLLDTETLSRPRRSK